MGKRLGKINESNQLSLQHLIRDMGREIVRRESKDPGERSRWWDADDIGDLITRHKGGEKVEALKLEKPVFKDMPVSTKGFSKMKNLRLLQIDHLNLQGSFKNMFKELSVKMASLPFGTLSIRFASGQTCHLIFYIFTH